MTGATGVPVKLSDPGVGVAALSEAFLHSMETP
jgi:hypothetical protein